MSPLERQAYVQSKILDVLPMTAVALERIIGISGVCVHRHLKRMHSTGLIHIGAWEAGEKRGAIGRVWHIGPGPDVEPPTPSPKAAASRRQRMKAASAKNSSKPVSGRTWILRQLGTDPIPVTSVRRGTRTQQAFSNLINRLAADGAISICKGTDENGHLLRMLRKGYPKTDEELQAREIARDRVAALVKRNRGVQQDRGEMLAMIWATAGRELRRAA